MRWQGRLIVCGLTVILWAVGICARAGEWREDFNKSLAEYRWWKVKGSIAVSKGWLVLTSTGKNGGGAEIQSRPEFKYRTLEVKASSKNWNSDTSISIEIWSSSGHRGIVVNNGCLGILDTSKPGENEIYKDIPGWDALKGKPHVFKFAWVKGKVDLYIDGKLAVSYAGSLVPNQPLKVRLCASNDFADQLRVDYVSVK